MKRSRRQSKRLNEHGPAGRLAGPAAVGVGRSWTGLTELDGSDGVGRSWTGRTELDGSDAADGTKAVDPLDGARRRAERALQKAWLAGHKDGGVVRQIEDGELDPAGAFDAIWTERYRAGVSAKLLPALSKAALDAAKATAGQMGVNWQLVNERVLDWSTKYGYTLVSGLTQTTQTQLQNTISAWIASGEPLPDLTAKLTEIFKSPVRAEMIASTEITRLYQVANEQSWRQANVELDAGIVGCEWRTAMDDKVCEICGPLDGQQRSLESPGYLHPEDGQLYLMPAHVRCRCAEVPVLSKPGSRQRGPGPVEVGG